MAIRYIPAAQYLHASRSTESSTAVDSRPQAKVSRCGLCGQWTWNGVCTLHPDAEQDSY